MGWLAEGFVFFCHDSYGEAPAGEASGSRVATPPGVLCPASLSPLFLPLHLSLAFPLTAGFGSPTARAAFEHVSVMQQPIKHGGDGGAVAQQLAPVFHWPIRCEQGAGAFVAPITRAALFVPCRGYRRRIEPAAIRQHPITPRGKDRGITSFPAQNPKRRSRRPERHAYG